MLQKLPLIKWFTPNIGIKRWLILSILGMTVSAVGGALIVLKYANISELVEIPSTSDWIVIGTVSCSGILITLISIRRLMHNILAPYKRHQKGHLVDMVVEHSRRERGIRFVAIGGGTGLPASLRGMKRYTNNITAIVTVADDGGSSGKLRREMGVPPPGDLRNNIAALADDNSLLTRLFQYRFESGELAGHAFGNLFIAALADIVQSQGNPEHNSLAEALVEVERILNIQGRVLPATLDDIHLEASIQINGSSRMIKVRGESQIGEVDGIIDTLQVIPDDAKAYESSIQAILGADIVVIGPGSLYTSILPNLLIRGIADALRASNAYRIYVCNVATQPVETDGYTVAEHVMALEKHIGRGVFQAVLANNVYPTENAGEKTHYVNAAPDHHEILQRYEVKYTDLTDSGHPWRHDPDKLATAILSLVNMNQAIVPIIKSAS